ncbi:MULTISPECIES: PIN-like domain-containing protein [unclassified Gordonia (in: high G+C Gram-positive bacteria)]|uniref:PIN-like domain-containing protein n=1 Tax=unclassified Gordonia (in: high G+C Gram-positive bacteria) TaxID=2657482 RepID=UPI001966BF13|nr:MULTISPECIES: PIN-like domain-containing protein [unclassified Gordonia (in: high G+C Gram-positive bacteria)]MBN0974156.1 DUF4935 domain-containing protein [Gordonia sp. BP-119]MBN0983960.1 DUF4935 domain-containing protein [Gordonia sp. BP-94]
MREVFGEWYPADGDDERRDFVTTARIALDANVLLDLYRISKESREKILAQLERDEIRPRLFLPYRAGLEYHRRRLTVAAEHAKQYSRATTLISGAKKNGAHSPLLQDLRAAVKDVKDTEVRERLLDAIDKAFKEAATAVSEALRTERESNILHPKQIQITDPIRDRIDKLFTDPGQIGKRRTATDLQAREDQARARLAAAMPPGTGADESKRDGGIGDPLIWMEMMDLAKTDEQNVLFVSNDMKADWRQIVDDKDFGTLPDLRREFADETGHRYHHISTDAFLDDLNKYLNADVDEDVIDEVKHARVSLTSAGTPHGGMRVTELYPELDADYREIARVVARNSEAADLLQSFKRDRGAAEYEQRQAFVSELAKIVRSPEFQQRIAAARRKLHDYGYSYDIDDDRPGDGDDPAEADSSADD